MVAVSDNRNLDINNYFNINSIINTTSKINDGATNLVELERKVRMLLDLFQREDFSIGGETYESVIEDLANLLNEMSDYASKYSSDINNSLNSAVIEKEEQLINYYN